MWNIFKKQKTYFTADEVDEIMPIVSHSQLSAMATQSSMMSSPYQQICSPQVQQQFLAMQQAALKADEDRKKEYPTLEIGPDIFPKENIVKFSLKDTGWYKYIDRWCVINLKDEYYIDQVFGESLFTAYFMSGEDAMAFKLRWL